MKVLQLIGATAAGGAERFAVELSRELRQLGMDVFVFALSSRADPAGDRMRHALDEAGIGFACGPARKVRFAAVRAYGRAVTDFGPELVHLHTENTELAHALARTLFGVTVPAARTIHNTRLRSEWPFRWAMRSNAIPVSATCTAAVDFSRYAPETRLRVIQNGVNFDWPVADSARREQARQRLGLETRTTLFVHVGRMDGARLENNAKAQDDLIRAWIAIKDRPDAELHLLGDGELRGQLEALAANEATIVFQGVRNDVIDWLTAADAFLLPSRFEGHPIAAIEAIGTGLPLILSSIPEFEALHAPGALSVTPGDVDGLAESIRRMIVAPPVVEADRVAAFRRRFSIRDTAAHYAEYYRDLLDAPGRSVS